MMYFKNVADEIFVAFDVLPWSKWKKNKAKSTNVYCLL